MEHLHNTRHKSLIRSSHVNENTPKSIKSRNRIETRNAEDNFDQRDEDIVYLRQEILDLKKDFKGFNFVGSLTAQFGIMTSKKNLLNLFKTVIKTLFMFKILK